MMDGVSYSARAPDPADYLRLFETTGWNTMYQVREDDCAQLLTASWHVEGAYVGDELVGMGRLLSDGVLYAVVFDLIVAPAWQRRGIGREVLRRLIARCDEAGIRDILLFSARGTVEFYRQAGFETRPDDAPGMILRRTG